MELSRDNSLSRESTPSEQRSKSDMNERISLDPEKEIFSSEQDVEKQAEEKLPSAETAATLATEEIDPSIVEFDGPDDPDNPKNWTARRRTIITVAMGL